MCVSSSRLTAGHALSASKQVTPACKQHLSAWPSSGQSTSGLGLQSLCRLCPFDLLLELCQAPGCCLQLERAVCQLKQTDCRPCAQCVRTSHACLQAAPGRLAQLWAEYKRAGPAEPLQALPLSAPLGAVPGAQVLLAGMSSCLSVQAASLQATRSRRQRKSSLLAGNSWAPGTALGQVQAGWACRASAGSAPFALGSEPCQAPRCCWLGCRAACQCKQACCKPCAQGVRTGQHSTDDSSALDACHSSGQI